MDAVQKIKMNVVGKLYEELRTVLCEGKLENKTIVTLGSKALVPKLDKIVDIVVPPFSDILRGKLESRGVNDLA